MTSCKLLQKPDKIEVVTGKLKIIPLDTTQGIIYLVINEQRRQGIMGKIQEPLYLIMQEFQQLFP